MKRKPTDRQAAAIRFIAANPEATVDQVCNAARVSQRSDNRAAFIVRLIDNGWVKLVTVEDLDENPI